MSTFSGALHGRRHALEPAHGPQADVEVEHLPQGDVQRADAAADRRGQRALDADEVLAWTGRDGLVGQPGIAELVQSSSGRRIPRLPGDLAFCRRRLSWRRRHQARGHWRFQISGPVPSPSMKGMTGMVGNLQLAAGNSDLFTHGRMISPHRVESPPCRCPPRMDSGCPRSGSRTRAPGCSGPSAWTTGAIRRDPRNAHTRRSLRPSPRASR